MTKIRKAIIIGIIVLAVGMPIVASFMNKRTTIDRLPWFIWDTSLSKDVLSEQEFAQAQLDYFLAENNPINNILDLLLSRRIRVIGVSGTKTGLNNAYPGTNKYHYRIYTYFNIPILEPSVHIGGEKVDAPILKEY